MPCGEKMDCLHCARAVDNPICHVYYKRGFHLSPHKCEKNVIFFLLKGEMLINSKEYAGTTLRAGNFILQAIDSKIEFLSMTETEGLIFAFDDPQAICYERYDYILKNIPPPLIFEPLKIKPELKSYIDGVISYINETKICKELLLFKRKELYYLITRYYSDLELSSIVHTLSEYTNGFQYFVLQHHKKVKTVEEFAQLGGYSVTTFRRIFKTIFKEPAYEWMMKQRKESILYQLRYTQDSISEICYNHGFESLPHFSNFCKKFFGASPRSLRNEEATEVIDLPFSET